MGLLVFLGLSSCTFGFLKTGKKSGFESFDGFEGLVRGVSSRGKDLRKKGVTPTVLLVARARAVPR